MSDPLAQAVLAGLDQTYDKRRWFEPVSVSVAGLTAAQAAWRPTGDRHSIWQNVRHLTHYCRLFTRRLEGEALPENFREGEFDPPDDPRDDAAWQDELRMLADAYETLRRTIKALPPGALTAPIAGGRAPVWYTVFGVHYHTAYHVGQIRLLRALQGV